MKQNPKGNGLNKLPGHSRKDLEIFTYALKSKLKNMPSNEQKVWAADIRDTCQKILDDEE